MSVTQLLDVFVLTSVEPVGGAELVSEQLKPAGILFGFYLINQSYFLSFLWTLTFNQKLSLYPKKRARSFMTYLLSGRSVISFVIVILLLYVIRSPEAVLIN